MRIPILYDDMANLEYRTRVIQQISERLKFSFDEKDLSPDLQRKIGILSSELKREHDLLGSISSLQSFGIEYVWSGYIIGSVILLVTVWAALGLKDAGVALLLGTLSLGVFALSVSVLRSFNRTQERLKSLSFQRNSLMLEISKKKNLLASEIFEELAEAHKLRLRPEVVEYRIVTEFSLKEGGFAMKCPHCGGSIDIIKHKIEGNVCKCTYCGNTLIVPDKILKML